MRTFIEGYSHFRNEVFPAKRDLFRRLAGEQHPQALLITCADSRIVPDLILQASPGELFICRNAGNMVPSYGSSATGGVTATIEYAVMVLEIPNIIVCGHSDCGAMRALLHPEKLTEMPAVRDWLLHGEVARRVVASEYPHLAGEDRLAMLTEENVIAQLDHLRTHPSVAARLAGGKIKLHGWVYEIGTGYIRAFDAGQGGFVPLAPGRIPSATPEPRPRRTPVRAIAGGELR